jgi:hypothetical protein
MIYFIYGGRCGENNHLQLLIGIPPMITPKNYEDYFKFLLTNILNFNIGTLYHWEEPLIDFCVINSEKTELPKNLTKKMKEVDKKYMKCLFPKCKYL